MVCFFPERMSFIGCTHILFQYRHSANCVRHIKRRSVRCFAIKRHGLGVARFCILPSAEVAKNISKMADRMRTQEEVGFFACQPSSFLVNNERAFEILPVAFDLTDPLQRLDQRAAISAGAAYGNGLCVPIVCILESMFAPRLCRRFYQFHRFIHDGLELYDVDEGCAG